MPRKDRVVAAPMSDDYDMEAAHELAAKLLNISCYPEDWGDQPLDDLHIVWRYFFTLQAKIRHITVKAQKTEGLESFPDRVPTHEDISTGSLLLTNKFGHGPAIAAAITICDKGWYVWQRDKRHPEGNKMLMQFAYIREHLVNETGVMVQLTAKGTAKIATQADRDRLDKLRKKLGLPALKD